MKILLIGRNGQLAWELMRTLACLGSVIAIDRKSHPVAIDLVNKDSISAAVQTIAPGLIVNASAYTAVDRAEQESEDAYRVNAHAPGILAELAVELNAGLIHYSTDYVFNGNAEHPYSEEMQPEPQSVYGASKLAGESAIVSIGPQHLIFRTAWVYGHRRNNFLLTVLRLLREKDSISIVRDQIGAPTWARQIAEATALAIAKCAVKGQFRPDARSGIYHMTCGGQTSWYGFAQKINEISGDNGLLGELCAEIYPVTTAEYPTDAVRPAYSVLSNDKFENEFNLRLPNWKISLDMCLSDVGSCRNSLFHG